MRVIEGVSSLGPSDGPVFVVVGVFDGLHRGHAYLLGHLVAEARTRAARSTVITFDAHPDAVLTGSAPSLLLDPRERARLLGEAGVDVLVVVHFDDVMRRTAYDAFVGSIADRVELAGFLMTPDAAFGYERRGTPDALAALGETRGFDVVVVAPFDIDGRSVRSTDIRAAIEIGDLAAAEALLGRPYTVMGRLAPDGAVLVELPVAMPPEGTYAGAIEGRPADIVIADGRITVLSKELPAPSREVRLTFGGPALRLPERGRPDTIRAFESR